MQNFSIEKLLNYYVLFGISNDVLLMTKIMIFQAKIRFKIYTKILDSTITNSSETAQLFRIPIKCRVASFDVNFFQLL